MSRSRVDKIMSIAFPAIVIALAYLYYYVNPGVSRFPIQCPWRVLTGTLCPACGSQRALHALVHGQLAQAWSYNYFFIISIPYAMLAVLVAWYNFGNRLDWLKNIVFHPVVLKAYVILFCTWWVARNLLHI